MLIVNMDKAVIRVLLDIARKEEKTEPVSLHIISQILSRIEEREVSFEETREQARILEIIGLAEIKGSTIEARQVGYFLGRTLDWRDEEKVKIIIEEVLNTKPA